MAYDLNRVTKEFRQACVKAGAGTGAVVPIRLNGRLTRTLGRVHQEYDPQVGGYVSTLVEFSKQLLETATDASIREVILHEAAHLIVTDRTLESHGHDAMFKAVCAEIGTSNDGVSTKVERTVEEKSLYKYNIFCPTCHKTIGGYNRRCKTIDNIAFCTCKGCGKGGLQVIQNW